MPFWFIAASSRPQNNNKNNSRPIINRMPQAANGEKKTKYRNQNKNIWAERANGGPKWCLNALAIMPKLLTKYEMYPTK